MSQAFFYVDGIPTKGKWVDLEYVTSMDDVMEELAEAGFIPRNEDGDPEYGGDVLIADCEGLARAFYHSRSDTMDLDDFIEARDYCDRDHVDEDAVIAYISHFSNWDQSSFEDAFSGAYDSEVAYAEQLVDDCGYLQEMPEHLRNYFDYEAFARDLFITDYTMVDGFVFRVV